MPHQDRHEAQEDHHANEGDRERSGSLSHLTREQPTAKPPELSLHDEATPEAGDRQEGGGPGHRRLRVPGELLVAREAYGLEVDPLVQPPMARGKEHDIEGCIRVGCLDPHNLFAVEPDPEIVSFAKKSQAFSLAGFGKQLLEFEVAVLEAEQRAVECLDPAESEHQIFLAALGEQQAHGFALLEAQFELDLLPLPRGSKGEFGMRQGEQVLVNRGVPEASVSGLERRQDVSRDEDPEHEKESEREQDQVA